MCSARVNILKEMITYFYFPALRDEETIRSPMILDEASNDEKASTEMQLYGEDGDTGAENEILKDENGILGKNRYS